MGTVCELYPRIVNIRTGTYLAVLTRSTFKLTAEALLLHKFTSQLLCDCQLFKGDSIAQVLDYIVHWSHIVCPCVNVFPLI